MKITIIGTGYVGLTTGVALAYIGHDVTCIDRNKSIIENLTQGVIPIHEPGLDSLFGNSISRLRFLSELNSKDTVADAILICVGTPPQQNGDADLRYVEESAYAIGTFLHQGHEVVVVNKSTVPVGSSRRVKMIINSLLSERGIKARVSVASNPEFLREGAALHDTFYPDRIVIGADERWAVKCLYEMYAPILDQTFIAPAGLPRPDGKPLPVLVTTNPTSAELVKYASNAFLAMKISFANEISGIAERVGADITEVMKAVGLDQRIGMRYLGAGAGWGGSCFGKDLTALRALGAQYGYDMPLVEATVSVNERQRKLIVEKLQQSLKIIRGSVITLWGLAFKPNTDDLRDAPAIEIAKMLTDLGARVRAYDPVAVGRARKEHKDLNIDFADSPLDSVQGADAVVLMTEWDIFQQLDWEQVKNKMQQPVLIDGRNFLDPSLVESHGFRYLGIGR